MIWEYVSGRIFNLLCQFLKVKKLESDSGSSKRHLNCQKVGINAASMVQWLGCLPGIWWFPHRRWDQILAREKFRYFGCFIPISVRRRVKFECESRYCLTVDKSLMTNQ